MLNEKLIIQSRIVLVDDEPANLMLLERILQWAGYENISSFSDPAQALMFCRNTSADIVLLDLHMPKIDGFEVLSQLREETSSSEYVPILVFTADVNPESRKKALELGANDFLTKPGDATEIMLRVRNFLQIRHLHQQLEHQKAGLEIMVQERTLDLEAARHEALEKLAKAAEFRDDDTGEHTKRVGDLAASIASSMGWSDEEVQVMRLAAPLHDIGKIGIPDSVLLKPGRLTPEEREIINTHAAIGAEILSGSASPVLQMAEIIARCHHEKWDGSGYPHGRQGCDIPLAARIVAIADVYDALTNKRPYKEPWPTEQAVAEIEKCAGTHFDPSATQAFLSYVRGRAVHLAA